MPTNTATFEALNAELAKAQAYVQLRVAILAKWQALPDNEAKRLLVAVACNELARSQAAQARIVRKIKEAELAEAEQAAAQARYPTAVYACMSDVRRIRAQLALALANEIQQ